MPPDLGQAVHAAGLALALAGVLFLPGLVAVALAGHRADGSRRLALAPGISAALWPLVMLWTTVAGGHWSPLVSRVAVATLVVVAAALFWRSLTVAPLLARRPAAAALALLAVLAVTAVTRITQVRDVAVPLWVDGYHHTLMAQLITDSGTVPSSLRPFLPIDGFFYHFGFHALSAVFAWLSGASVPRAVLWMGQALSTVAVLSTYAFAQLLVRQPAAAAAAAAVPASLYYFPAYFTTWGRYTQLAGLVVLPVALILVADAIESPRPASERLLAAAVAAGLLLVHYRVFVFFLIGVALIAIRSESETVRRAPARDEARARRGRLAGVAALGGVLAAPWIAGHLWSGVQSMMATSPDWYRAPAAVNDVPDWLFSVGTNGIWLMLALVGLEIGLIRRRAAAVGLAGGVALAILAARPEVLGLPTTYLLPPFAVAISAFLPVAIGIALLAEAGLDLATLVQRTYGRSTDPRRSPQLAPTVLLAAVVALTLWGARRTPGIQAVTIIAQAADLEAADWIRSNTTPDACFLVNATHWHLNTYRGSDGGYWLPVLAGRPTTMPAALYNAGDADYARTVLGIAQTLADSDALDDQALLDLMDRTGAEYVYVGPASTNVGGSLDAERLRTVVGLTEVYARAEVFVFQLANPAAVVKPGAENVVCQPVAPARDPAR